MAGIIVSGGIYSGSGDVTADWFYQHYNIGGGSSRVYLPDGTMTLTSETGNSAFRNDWMGSSDYFQHQNGTVKITHAGGTTLHMIGAGPVASGRSGQLYDVIINQNSNPRVTDAVLINTVASDGFYAGIQNSLTIISGTARIGNTTATNYTKIGHVYIGASGTFSAGNVATVNNAGYNNWDSSGSISVKSVLFNGTNGVFVANSGTIQVLGPYSGNDSDHFVWDNNSKGTVYHNSGTIQFGGVGLLAIGQSSENATYNNYRNNNRAADGTGQSSNGDGGYLYNMSVGFRDGDSPTRHLGLQAVSNILVGNDLTVLTSGGIDKSSYGSTISGSVELKGDAFWGNYAAQGGTNTWGRLYMAEGSSFKAPTGTLVLNKVIGGYTMYNPEGTFVHNDGTVAINFTGTDASQVRNQSYFYNYEQTLPAPTNRVNWRGDGSAPYAFRIANNATIKEGSFRPTSPTNTMVISGALEVQSGGNYGYSAGDFEAEATIGSIDIQSGGNMYASTGTTYITDQLGNEGTLINNDGTVFFSGSNLNSYFIDQDLSSPVDPVFHNLTYSGANTYLMEDITIENTFLNPAGYIRLTADKTITLGTSTSKGYLDLKGNRMYPYGDSHIYGASEIYPAGLSGTHANPILWSYGEGADPNTPKIKWLDFAFDIDTVGDDKVTMTVEGYCNFQAVTLVSGTNFTVASGQRASFNDTLTINSHADTSYDGGKFIISGALVEMTGAGNWSEGGYQQYMGRDSASVIWNSTGYYSPNGGYLNTGWKNVFWNAEARINQDGPFRNSNLIVAGQLDANNRAIGTTSRPSKIVVANGGTVSSSANVFHASTFSNRGGLFASSSAFDFDGSSGLINAGAGSSIDDIFDGGGTIEGWVNLDSGGGANVGRLVSKDAYFIYFREDSFNNIRLQYTFNGGGAEWYTENDSFTFDSKWHHVAVTYDNSDIANDPSIYLDGKLLPLGTIVRPTGTRASDVGDVLYVGNNPTDIRALEGRLGMLRIFSDIRTAAEIRTDMFNQNSDMVEKTDLELMYQFDEGQGTTVTDVSTNSNTGTITLGTSAWANAGTWTAGNKLGSATGVIAGNIYIGKHTSNPTVFGTSYFPINNRRLIDGAKFASKSHMSTEEYYISTSGTGDYLNYSALVGAPVGTESEVKIIPPQAGKTGGSYFTFDSDANNEQCHTLVNLGGSFVRVVNNSDFYTQSFDNEGTWLRGSPYDGVIHDDGSTPHEYQPIDLMDDQDSGFDTVELID